MGTVFLRCQGQHRGEAGTLQQLAEGEAEVVHSYEFQVMSWVSLRGEG